METQGTQNTQNAQNTVTSEIARLIQEWDAVAEATRLALSGYAITARHDFINKRMQEVGYRGGVDLLTQAAKEEALKAQNRTASGENSMNGEKKIL